MTIPTRYVSPVSCDDLRAVFSKDAPDPNEYGVERLGAFRGHLSLCAKCQATYGARLEELVQQTLSPKIIRGLGATMSVDVQQELLARLTHPDLCIRMAAVDALGTLGTAMPVAVQEALVARLADPDWTVRMGAVQALSHLGTTMSAAVRQALEARLADPDQDVRQVAEEALSLVGPPPVKEKSRSVSLQRLVAATRDLLWSLCAPTLTPAFATMSGSHSHRVMLEEEDIKGTTISSTIVLTEEDYVLTGPLLTGPGRFQLALHGPGSRLVGKDLCCELQLIEGQTLSLRAPIRTASNGKGWEVTVDEQVLTDPSLHSEADHHIPFDRDSLRLVVRPSQA